jgi:pimeloyl-ACP methyl ester carboxylesterase
MMFAATYPERVSHLILFGTFARFLSTDDYPLMRSKEELFRLIDYWAEHWGDGVSMQFFLPSCANQADVARQYAKLERLVYSPGALKLMIQYNMEIDVRSVLSSIRMPTLVLH